jgi:hypothetical protein
MTDLLSVGVDGQVYRALPNDPPVEDDWGSFVLVTPAELLAEIERLRKIERTLRPVLAGLKAGDSIATAWHEWPEARDLEAVAEALRASSHKNSPDG